jgi:hypothetical protein
MVVPPVPPDGLHVPPEPPFQIPQPETATTRLFGVRNGGWGVGACANTGTDISSSNAIASAIFPIRISGTRVLCSYLKLFPLVFFGPFWCGIQSSRPALHTHDGEKNIFARNCGSSTHSAECQCLENITVMPATWVGFSPVRLVRHERRWLALTFSGLPVESL